MLLISIICQGHLTLPVVSLPILTIVIVMWHLSCLSSQLSICWNLPILTITNEISYMPVVIWPLSFSSCKFVVTCQSWQSLMTSQICQLSCGIYIVYQRLSFGIYFNVSCQWDSGGVRCLRLLPNGKWSCPVSDGRAHLWDVLLHCLVRTRALFRSPVTIYK